MKFNHGNVDLQIENKMLNHMVQGATHPSSQGGERRIQHIWNVKLYCFVLFSIEPEIRSHSAPTWYDTLSSCKQQDTHHRMLPKWASFHDGGDVASRMHAGVSQQAGAGDQQ